VSYKFRDHIKNNRFVTTHVYEENKFIYMRPGRSASTVIVKTINQKNTEVSLPYFRKSGTNEWLENITDDEILNDYFVFTFVRNPYGRLVSAWEAFSKQKRSVSDFKEFVKGRGGSYLFEDGGSFVNDHWFPLCNYVEFKDGERFVDFIGKVESIEEDWNKVKKRIGCGNTEIVKGRFKPYESYYDTVTLKRVSEIYKRDLELFDYEF
tara:strand:- start:932 stop:1555 length:624 start_codon:yes stop_codon:yes gene_type:complete